MPFSLQSPLQMQISSRQMPICGGAFATAPSAGPVNDRFHVPTAGPPNHFLQATKMTTAAEQFAPSPAALQVHYPRCVSAQPQTVPPVKQAQANQNAATQQVHTRQFDQKPFAQAQAVQPSHDPQPIAVTRQLAEKSPKDNECDCAMASFLSGEQITCALCRGDKVPIQEALGVSCVSLGSWCGVGQCLRGLQLRDTAFPFDWMRVSTEGVIHFLETKFEDFLQYDSTKDFPWDPHHGGKAYCGAYHSFWHDDLSKTEESEKYKRRIERFFQNPSEKLVFIRACNDSADVIKAKELLAALQRAFPGKHIWLLLIVDSQSSAGSYVAEGTNGRLLVHLTDKRHLRTWMYRDDVKAYEEAVRMVLNVIHNGSKAAPYLRPIGSLTNFAASLEQFTGGNTQSETWDPKPLQSEMPEAVDINSCKKGAAKDKAAVVESLVDNKAYEEAARTVLNVIRNGTTAVPYLRPSGSLTNFAASLEQFTGGNTRSDTWDPKTVAEQMIAQLHDGIDNLLTDRKSVV